MRILTVCEHGNIRSVALAYLIKTVYKHEAIAVGIENCSHDTIQMLYKWADKVVFLERALIPKDVEGLSKINVIDLGKDVWKDARHPELLHKLLKKIGSLNL